MAATTAAPRSFWEEFKYVQSDSPVLGMQLWHLVAFIVMGICVLLTVVCCFIDWRIPRTRKEIELDRQLRRMAEDYAEQVMNKMKEDENRDEEEMPDTQRKKISPVFKV